MLYDENGDVINIKNILEDKLDRLYSEIDDKAEEIYVTSTGGKGKVKMGSRLSTCLYAFFAKEPLMSRAEYVTLSAEELGLYYSAYMEMLDHYNLYEVPSSRQLFSAFCGFTVAKFIDLMNSNDLALQERAIMINDGFDGQIFASAESSGNNSTAVLTRGQLKEVGQGHKKAEDEINFNIVPQSNPAVLLQKAQEIAKAKQLSSGKK